MSTAAPSVSLVVLIGVFYCVYPPGVGVQFGYDLPLIAALFFVIAFAAILLNVIVDILYAWLDPRVRLG